MHKKAFFSKIILLFLLAILLYVAAYSYSLSKIELKTANISGIEDVTLSGFTLTGDLVLYNGGIVPIRINHVQYELILESGIQISNGSIPLGKVKPKQTRTFYFEDRIGWIPTAQSVIEMLGPGSTYAMIEGTVYVKDTNTIDITIPFSHPIDLESYVRLFAASQVQSTIAKAADALKNLLL